MGIHDGDRKILREVARRYGDVASLDVHERTKADWVRLNSLRPARPMVMIDQIPWNEMNGNGELTLRCEDPFLRSLEWAMRSDLYKWDHFRCDMVIERRLEVPKVYRDPGYGVAMKYRDGDLEHGEALTHTYADQIPDDDALARLKTPEVEFDEDATRERETLASEMVGDILPIHLTGVSIWAAVWDRIVFWRGATPVLYDLADRPDFLHRLMRRMMDIEMRLLDRFESQNLLEPRQGLIHCCGAYTDALPGPDAASSRVTAKECWAAGAAQIFSEVSPAMHEEFEIDYLKPYLERFGLVNYGCCEPLHRKIPIIRKIRNVRTISVSPWADVDIAARNIGGDYVMARKSNPSLVAMQCLDPERIAAETRATLEACRRYNTPCEFILKDITTVCNEPERLTKWYEAVSRTIEEFQG